MAVFCSFGTYVLHRRCVFVHFEQLNQILISQFADFNKLLQADFRIQVCFNVGAHVAYLDNACLDLFFGKFLHKLIGERSLPLAVSAFSSLRP